MKKYILMFGLTLVMGLFISNTVVAQWTSGGGITYTMDKVGIGTATPGTKLHVFEPGTGIADIWASKNLPGNGQVARLRLINDATGSLFNLSLRTVGGQEEMLQSVRVGTAATPFFREYVYMNVTTGKYEMRSGVTDAEFLNNGYLLLNNTQSVGIGVPLADVGKLAGAKLGVNGKIIATEVEVKLFGSWPDFVFKKDYQLMPLCEVENFINENGHLPNVPNETQVKENGINLGQMDGILLQKIEELTLHIIQLNKRIAELEK